MAASLNTLQRAALWLAKQPEGPDLDKAYLLASILFGKSLTEVKEKVDGLRVLLA